MNNVETQVKQIVLRIVNLSEESPEFSVSASLQDDFNIDSLVMLEIITTLEETFEIMFSDDELLNQDQWLHSVETLSAFVEHKLTEK